MVTGSLSHGIMPLLSVLPKACLDTSPLYSLVIINHFHLNKGFESLLIIIHSEKYMVPCSQDRDVCACTHHTEVLQSRTHPYPIGRSLLITSLLSQSLKGWQTPTQFIA